MGVRPGGMEADRPAEVGVAPSAPGTKQFQVGVGVVRPGQGLAAAGRAGQFQEEIHGVGIGRGPAGPGQHAAGVGFAEQQAQQVHEVGGVVGQPAAVGQASGQKRPEAPAREQFADTGHGRLAAAVVVDAKRDAARAAGRDHLPARVRVRGQGLFHEKQARRQFQALPHLLRAALGGGGQHDEVGRPGQGGGDGRESRQAGCGGEAGASVRGGVHASEQAQGRLAQQGAGVGQDQIRRAVGVVKKPDAPEAHEQRGKRAAVVHGPRPLCGPRGG
ncbi:hypothetical protein DSECCO2_652710 [anaerobic digester metagenome]